MELNVGRLSHDTRFLSGSEVNFAHVIRLSNDACLKLCYNREQNMRIFVLLFTVRSIYILTLIKMAKPNAVQFLSAHLKTLRLFEIESLNSAVCFSKCH